MGTAAFLVTASTMILRCELAYAQSSQALASPDATPTPAAATPPPANGVPPEESPAVSPGAAPAAPTGASGPIQSYPPPIWYPPPDPYAPSGAYGPACPPPPPCPCPCQQAAPAPGARAHDGVYLRMQLGATYAGLSAKSDATHLQFSGSGPSLGVALGKSVRPNLALFGAFMLASSVDPRFKVNGVATSTVSGSTDLVLFGVGAAYYLEPANVFVSATVGVSKLDFQDNQNVVLYESQWGLGGELLAGKEWWVSDEWGLGVSGQLLLATASGKGVLAPGESTPTWSGAAFSVLFSSTYN